MKLFTIGAIFGATLVAVSVAIVAGLSFISGMWLGWKVGTNDEEQNNNYWTPPVRYRRPPPRPVTPQEETQS